MYVLPDKSRLEDYVKSLNDENLSMKSLIHSLDNLYAPQIDYETLFKLINEYLKSYYFLTHWSNTCIIPLLDIMRGYSDYHNYNLDVSWVAHIDNQLMNALVYNNATKYTAIFKQYTKDINNNKKQNMETIASLYFSKSEMNKLRLLE